MEVVDAIEDEGRKIAVSPDDYAKMFLSKFIAKTRCRNTTDAYGELTFEKLVLELEQGEKKFIRLN